MLTRACPNGALVIACLRWWNCVCRGESGRSSCKSPLESVHQTATQAYRAWTMLARSGLTSSRLGLRLRESGLTTQERITALQREWTARRLWGEETVYHQLAGVFGLELSLKNLFCSKIKYLYDGQCKVCNTFKSALQVEEQEKERIDFINIADDSFDPKKNNDVSYDDAMSTIHAITLEGKTVKGPDAVKELFAAAGPRLGFAANVAKLPGFAQAFGFLYKQLSIYRFPISNAATKAKETIGKE